MRRDESERRLRDLLEEAGLPARPGGRLRRVLGRGSGGSGRLDEHAAATAWTAFKRFAAEPVEGVRVADESDGLLFQHGTYDWFDGSGPHFEFSLVRQFTVGGDDNDDEEMEQLDCRLVYDPAPALEALDQVSEWSFGHPLPEWLAAMDRQPVFDAIARAGLVPVRLSVALEPV